MSSAKQKKRASQSNLSFFNSEAIRLGNPFVKRFHRKGDRIPSLGNPNWIQNCRLRIWKAGVLSLTLNRLDLSHDESRLVKNGGKPASWTLSSRGP